MSEDKTNGVADYAAFILNCNATSYPGLPKIQDKTVSLAKAYLRAEAQLAIALAALDQYANENKWLGSDKFNIAYNEAPWFTAQEALEQIKAVG
jgi:hypothetical protein